jgi:hypothetical protein
MAVIKFERDENNLDMRVNLEFLSSFNNAVSNTEIAHLRMRSGNTSNGRQQRRMLQEVAVASFNITNFKLHLET